MRSQQRLRDELEFVTEFNTLFDVVQQMAISHLRRSEERLAGEVLLTEVLVREFFRLLPTEARSHPLVHGRGRGRLLVVITSDEGLVGPLYAAVMRKAFEVADGAPSRWLLIGQRGLRLLGPQAEPPHVIPIPADDEVEPHMRRVSQFVLGQFQRTSLEAAWMVAARFLSPTRQDVIARQLLPVPVPSSDPGVSRDLILEPSLPRLIERLASAWVEAVCAESFWSARRAEFAARALHVEASRQELARRARAVRHEFFKTIHERVDVLVRETSVVQRHMARSS
jgi:F0F1-type ATP synthase gamma subunit